MADQTVNPQWANEDTAAFNADRATRVLFFQRTSPGGNQEA